MMSAKKATDGDQKAELDARIAKTRARHEKVQTAATAAPADRRLAFDFRQHNDINLESD